MQADIRTIAELGGYAVSAITSITVQNTLGIQEFFDIPTDIVSGQIESIMNDMHPDIVKIGMLYCFLVDKDKSVKRIMKVTSR